MPEIALHILDLAENCVKAGAGHVIITVSLEGDQLCVTIEDDGCGMDEALLARVESPFATTRTTRKVGLGIPMFKQLAEMCEGTFSIRSEKGRGTLLAATFRRSHVDLPPIGDLAGTMRTLIIACPDRPEFCLRYRQDGEEFVFDTQEIRKAVGGLSLNEPEILEWIGEYLTQGLAEAAGSHRQEQ